jgi:hypothetical protein
MDDLDLTPVEYIKPKEYPIAAVFWALLILVLVTFGRFAFADDLVYQSQTLSGTDTLTDGPSVSTTPDSDAYIIDVNVTGPLAPNLNMQMVTPNSWTVSCTRCLGGLSSGQSTVPNDMTSASAVFMFSTDSTGKITAWNFSISSSFELIDPTSPNPCCLYQGSANFSSGDTATGTWQSNHTVTQLLTAPKGAWTQSSLSNPAPAVTVLARTCNGTWAAPSNTAGAGLAQTASGAGMNCRVPANYSPSWYIKVTTDGGKTYEFVTLASLGLGN